MLGFGVVSVCLFVLNQKPCFLQGLLVRPFRGFFDGVFYFFFFFFLGGGKCFFVCYF